MQRQILVVTVPAYRMGTTMQRSASMSGPSRANAVQRRASMASYRDLLLAAVLDKFDRIVDL